eukprot:m.225685 g.225685  ORF g.225685 m.225685 type:complete len:123 (-) comp19211_c0_seq3:1220-1588(-)
MSIQSSTLHFPPSLRPRRNRSTPVMRAAVRETWLEASHFVLPLFVHDKEEDEEVTSMPGCSRLSLMSLIAEVEGAIADGIGMVEVSFTNFVPQSETISAAKVSDKVNLNILVCAVCGSEWRL